MVILYGVIHGAHQINFFGGVEREITILPTKELIADLSRFPKGTRVGLESMSKKDWEEVRLHILTEPFNPPELRYDDMDTVSRPYYSANSTDYWEKLEKVCLDLGFDIVFLDDKDIWFKYNHAMLRNVENNVRRMNLLVVQEGESDEHYDRKRIGFNVEEHRDIVSAKKIHEIDRDIKLLKTIKSSGVDIAFVGPGHSDYWVVNSQIIRQNYGLSFEEYSAEVPKEGVCSLGCELTKFVKDTNPNLGFAFTRNSLERTVRLLETGRFSDKKPDYVGTWDIHTPTQGYFEMFFKRDGGRIKGEMIDCFGDAIFDGEIKDNEIRFVKIYKPDKSSSSASSDDIVYKGLIREDNIIGYFALNGMGSPFYATPNNVKDFVDLGMSFRSSSKKHRSDMKSLEERLFE